MITRTRRYHRKSHPVNGWFDVSPSSPDARTYAGFDSDIDDWDCDTWKLYYMRNKQYLGKAKAQEVFMTDVGRTSACCPWLELCKYDCQFITYLKSEGLDYESIWSDIACFASNITSSAKNLSKFLVPAGLFIGGLMVYDQIEKRRK